MEQLGSYDPLFGSNNFILRKKNLFEVQKIFKKIEVVSYFIFKIIRESGDYTILRLEFSNFLL